MSYLLVLIPVDQLFMLCFFSIERRSLRQSNCDKWSASIKFNNGRSTAGTKIIAGKLPVTKIHTLKRNCIMSSRIINKDLLFSMPSLSLRKVDKYSISNIFANGHV